MQRAGGVQAILYCVHMVMDTYMRVTCVFALWLALSSPAPRERPARSVRPSHFPIQEVVSLVTRAPPTCSPARSSLKVSRSDPQRPSAHVSGRSAPGSHPIPFFSSIREFIQSAFRNHTMLHGVCNHTKPATRNAAAGACGRPQWCTVHVLVMDITLGGLDART